MHVKIRSEQCARCESARVAPSSDDLFGGIANIFLSWKSFGNLYGIFQRIIVTLTQYVSCQYVNRFVSPVSIFDFNRSVTPIGSKRFFSIDYLYVVQEYHHIRLTMYFQLFV